MTENTLQPRNPLLFFISKIFILAGLVLVFTMLAAFAGGYAARLMFGVDIFNDPGVTNLYETRPEVMNTLKLVQCFYTIGAFLIPALIFPRALQQWTGDFLHSNRLSKFFFYALGLAIMVASVPFTSWLVELNEILDFPEYMSRMLLQEKEMEKMIGLMVQGDNAGMLLINMMFVAVLPAICEEFFFRGALMRFLMMCIRNRHAAVVITALAFSLFHFQFYGMIPRFALGIFLGYIAFYSGSLWPAIVAHFFNNALALLAIHYHWDQSGIPMLSENYSFPLFIALLSAAATAGIIVVMRNQRFKTIWYNGE